MFVEVAQEKFELLPEKVIHWEKEKTLLLADLHLGKVNHFRRSGIAVSQQPNDHNIERLINLLRQAQPSRVIFMGDLFHSHYNSEWEVFGQVLSYFPAISFELVMGNHDIMSEYQYLKHKLILHPNPIPMGPFIISHEPLENISDKAYNLAGHVHPGVRLRGKGRQGITLPCFYFSEKAGLLPAFGGFTGLHKIKLKKDDIVFVIAEDKIFKI